jgi:hypothetical protein
MKRTIDRRKLFGPNVYRELEQEREQRERQQKKSGGTASNDNARLPVIAKELRDKSAQNSLRCDERG